MRGGAGCGAWRPWPQSPLSSCLTLWGCPGKRGPGLRACPQRLLVESLRGAAPALLPSSLTCPSVGEEVGKPRRAQAPGEGPGSRPRWRGPDALLYACSKSVYADTKCYFSTLILVSVFLCMRQIRHLTVPGSNTVNQTLDFTASVQYVLFFFLFLS